MSNCPSDLVLPQTSRHATQPDGGGASASTVDAADTDHANSGRDCKHRAVADLWDTVGSLTVIVPIKHGANTVDRLRATLARIDAIIRDGKSPLAAVKEIHVARWVVLPERVRGRGAKMRPSLVMWNTFDGTRDAHLHRLVAEARTVLDQIYQHCEGYPGRHGSAEKVEEYLCAHEAGGRVASFVGTPGIAVDTVRQQQLLVNVLVDHLRPLRRSMERDRTRQPGLSNPHLFLAAQEFLWNQLGNDRAHPGLQAFALRRPVTPVVRNLTLDLIWNLLGSRIVVPILGLVIAAVVGFGLWWHIPLEPWPLTFYVLASVASVLGLAGVLVALWGFALRWAEKREARQWIPAPIREFRDHDEHLRVRDNEGPGINRVTIVTDLKPGWVRQVTLRFVLWLVAFRAGRNFEGALQGVETIHFAQWRIIDGGRRLMFLSNYDGQPLDYFADFAESSAPGVNAIWGNTEGMPSTTALIGDGSRNLEAFENAARVHQIPTDAWYCGYETRRFVTRLINDNWRIHRLLHEFPTPSQVDEWVMLLREKGL